MPRICATPANASRNNNERVRNQKVQGAIAAIAVFLKMENQSKQNVLEAALRKLESNAQDIEQERLHSSLLDSRISYLEKRLQKSEEELEMWRTKLVFAPEMIQPTTSLSSDSQIAFPELNYPQNDFNMGQQQILNFPPLFQNVPGMEGDENELLTPPSSNFGTSYDVEVCQMLQLEQLSITPTAPQVMEEPTASNEDFGKFSIPDGMDVNVDLDNIQIDLLTGENEELLDELEKEEQIAQAVLPRSPSPSPSYRIYTFDDLMSDTYYS